jgi:hypothetical protein
MSSGEPLAPGQPAGAPQPEAESSRRQSLAPAIFPLDRLTRKNPWVAALFALLFGPLGMLYSTATGALVMCVMYVLLLFIAGGRLAWAVWPICIFWAAMAARE